MPLSRSMITNQHLEFVQVLHCKFDVGPEPAFDNFLPLLVDRSKGGQAEAFIGPICGREFRLGGTPSSTVACVLSAIERVYWLGAKWVTKTSVSGDNVVYLSIALR